MRNLLLSLFFLLSLNLNSYGQVPTPSNYIIFFDLSSRIENSNQPEKDKELLKYLVKNFQTKVEKLYRSGKIYSEDKLTILFYPDLNDENILVLTSSMNIDFGKRNFNNRLDYFVEQFPKSGTPEILKTFEKIYDIALKQSPNYFGSNIHDFFSYSIQDYLDDHYHNHIILFTDGYMYMAGENPERKGNVLGHLEGSMLDPLRSSANWEKTLKTDGWKIASSGIKLPTTTTVTLLEITPDCINNTANPRTRIRPLQQCPNEFRILSKLWEDWFLDMGVSKSKIFINKTSNNLNGVESNLDSLFSN